MSAIAQVFHRNPTSDKYLVTAATPGDAIRAVGGVGDYGYERCTATMRQFTNDKDEFRWEVECWPCRPATKEDIASLWK